MTVTPTYPAASQQAAVDAALLVLKSMGLFLEDPTAATRQRLPAPTFAEYVPVVSAAVTDGTRRAYGTYWNRITEQWGARRLDEPTPSQVRQLMKLVKANAVHRRNGLGGRSAEEHLVAALRCLYRHAEDDGLIDERDNPARKVGKRRFGFAVAQAYAGHQNASQGARAMGATGTYVRARLPEVATALSVLTGEPHPLAPEGSRTDINHPLGELGDP